MRLSTTAMYLSAVAMAAASTAGAGGLIPLSDGLDLKTAPDPGPTNELTVLADSLNPLRDHFNANRDKHRFITILSPT